LVDPHDRAAVRGAGSLAAGSITETQDALKDGVDRGYFTLEQIATAQALALRSLKVSTRLLLYLKRFNRSRH
jgi:hypothetical protein